MREYREGNPNQQSYDTPHTASERREYDSADFRSSKRPACFRPASIRSAKT
jgi:hypothetical protein